MTTTHFAELVRLTASTVHTLDRFGDDKVYISDLWTRLRHLAPSLAVFKDYLWAAHCAGCLTLARGDLPFMMDRARLESSEIQREFSTFHFLLAE